MNEIAKYSNTQIISINRIRINYNEKTYLIITDTLVSKEKSIIIKIIILFLDINILHI